MIGNKRGKRPFSLAKESRATFRPSDERGERYASLVGKKFFPGNEKTEITDSTTNLPGEKGRL